MVGPALHLPPWTVTFVVFLALLGFPIALVLAWAFEMAPDGVNKTESWPRPAAAEAPASRRTTAATLVNGVGIGILVAIVGFGAEGPTVALAIALERSGRGDEAMDRLAEVMRPGLIHPSVTLLYARAGRRDEAETILRELDERGLLDARVLHGRVIAAAARITLGQQDASIALLEDVSRDLSPRELLYHRCYSEFDALRGDPRYERIQRGVGLPGI